MKNMTVAFLSFFVLCNFLKADEEGVVCPRCQKIREYNAAHPENNYYWYDDYLKEKKEGPQPTSATPKNNLPNDPIK